MKNKNINNIMKSFNKEDLVTCGVVLICLVLYIIFPVNNIFQRIVSVITFLFVIPFLYIKIVLKKDMKSLGIQKGEWKAGVFWSIMAIIVSFLVEYILFKYLKFEFKYPFPPYLANNFPAFLAYEIIMVGMFTALYEFFFRGFLMLNFFNKFGIWSVLLQSLVFLILFLLAGKWALLPYIIFVFWSGIITYLSRSIVYSFASSVIFIIIFDSFFIYFTK